MAITISGGSAYVGTWTVTKGASAAGRHRAGSRIPGVPPDAAKRDLPVLEGLHEARGRTQDAYHQASADQDRRRQAGRHAEQVQERDDDAGDRTGQQRCPRDRGRRPKVSGAPGHEQRDHRRGDSDDPDRPQVHAGTSGDQPAGDETAERVGPVGARTLATAAYVQGEQQDGAQVGNTRDDEQDLASGERQHGNSWGLKRDWNVSPRSTPAV
ncbi:hypothetical protein [Fodinicola feengrottensis]|uniref:hypothetical protein n=1 Tax=Fodinicola feengrottensis TaxID=435914 RepID=UPI0013D4AE8D